MAGRSSVARKLSFTAIVIVALTLSSEIALRLVNPQIFGFVYAARQVHRYTTWHKVDLRPSTRAALQLERRDGSELFGFTLSVDEHGTRTQGLVTGRATGTTVVHCLGDSITMGWGVEDDETYPSQLARSLGASHTVLNLGVDGYGLLAARRKSEMLSNVFPPDVFVYLFCHNDPHDDAITQAVQARSSVEHMAWLVLDGLRHRTYLANVPFALKWTAFFAPALENAGGPSFDPPADDELSAAIEDAALPDGVTAEALVSLWADVRRAGQKLLFVAVDAEPISLSYVKLCREEGIPHIHLPLGDALRIPGDGHLNVEGNRHVAQQVSAVLRDTSDTPAETRVEESPASVR